MRWKFCAKQAVGTLKNRWRRAKSDARVVLGWRHGAYGETDAGVDVAAEDGGGDVHADAHGLVRVERDARLLGEVVDHHLAEVADVPDL